LLSLKKQTLYHDIYSHIQKVTHFSDKEMHRRFYNLYALMQEEDKINVKQEVNKLFRTWKMKYCRKKG
jgi:hypothetical protein